MSKFKLLKWFQQNMNYWQIFGASGLFLGFLELDNVKFLRKRRLKYDKFYDSVQMFKFFFDDDEK